MRKLLVISITLLAIVATSCKPKAAPTEGFPPQGQFHQMRPGAPEHHQRQHRELSPEQKAEFEKWMKFDSLPETEQKALLAKRKAQIDEREAKRKAAKEEFEAKWANFDNLSIEEQKKLIDMKSGRWHHSKNHAAPQQKPQGCQNKQCCKSANCNSKP